jgi:ABC-type nitrate/sulfonate/bicarbonate transport system substrate-binding protein
MIVPLLRSKMTRRTFGSVAAGAFASGVLDKGALAAPEDIMVGEGISVGWATFYVADELNTWNGAGLLAKTATFPSGLHVLNAVAGGQVAIGTCAETPVVFSNLNGVPVRVIGVINTYEPFSLVANQSIQKATDCAGKKVGYVRGSNGHYYLAKLLKKYGMTMRDITAINLSPTDFVTSLVNGSLDAFAWNEPMISAAVKNGAGKIHVLSDPGLYHTFSSVITLQKTIDEKKPEIVASLRALLAADKAIRDDKDKAMEIVASRLKIGKDVVSSGWADPSLTSMKTLSDIADELHAQAEWAISENLTRPDAKILDFTTAVNKDLLAMAEEPSK